MQVLAHLARGARSRRARAPRRAAGGAARWRRRAPRAGARCSEIRPVIAPWTSVIARTSPASAWPRRARRASGCPPGGRRRSPRASPSSVAASSSSASRSARLGALGREHRHPHLDRHALIARLAPCASICGDGGSAGGSGSDDERPAAAPARRVQVPALAQRDERLAQRRARDPELRAQLALGRQARAGRQQPELDRRAQPLDRLLERGLRADRREHRVERSVATPESAAHRRGSQPLESPHALPVGDRRLERRELDVGGVEVVRDDLLAERRARDLAARRTARARRAASPAGAACSCAA